MTKLDVIIILLVVLIVILIPFIGYCNYKLSYISEMVSMIYKGASR